MNEVLKKYKVAVISAIIVLLVGITSLIVFNSFNDNSSLKNVNGKYYAFEYDNTWKLKEKRKDTVLLKHKSDSKITIQITELSDEYRYTSINELIDEVIYSVEKQNKSYNLISKNEDKITKYRFDGYKILYENDKEQVMIYLYKKSNKLISIRYEANNDYFDILLDSVHNIVNSLDIKEESFNLKNSLKIETSKIIYNTNVELNNKFIDIKNCEIAKNNYYVQYTIPDIFNQNDFDSQLGFYNLKLDSGDINITVDISKKNIYEYLDKEENINVYKNYSYYHDETTNDYSDFKESLTKLESNYDSYIYKNSYYYNNAIRYNSNYESENYKRQDENAELIYALNNNHILVIKIETKGLPITEKLINMIKIIKSTNYASYITSEKIDNNLVGTFKRFTDYNKNKIDLVVIKVPDKYVEIDKNVNNYLEKNYGLNYNEDMKIYDYNVHYELSKLEADEVVDIINSVYIKSTYGESHKLKYTGNVTINGKQFKVYDGGYTDISGIIFTDINRKKYYVKKKILFYKMPNEGNFYIEINGNGKEISNELINELANFTIEEKDYNKE